jgi:NADPH:quinone reductase-like Zn-dependent oxidoreductase
MPGLEFAGVVEATGSGVDRFAAGDRVMGLVPGCGQAERVVVHQRVAMPVPEGMSWPEAGGFPETFITAHDALFTQCALGAGERVLVNGAAGGVGTAAVQLAVAAGAEVVASSRSPSRHEALASLGAHAVVPEASHDMGPFDVVLELVGGPNLAGDLDSLRDGGRIVVIGLGAGARAEVNLGALMARRARIHGSTLRSRSLEDKAIATRLVEHHVLPLVARGRARVLVEDTFSFSDPDSAYERLSAGDKLGKIVLVSTPVHHADRISGDSEER